MFPAATSHWTIFLATWYLNRSGRHEYWALAVFFSDVTDAPGLVLPCPCPPGSKSQSACIQFSQNTGQGRFMGCNSLFTADWRWTPNGCLSSSGK